MMSSFQGHFKVNKALLELDSKSTLGFSWVQDVPGRKRRDFLLLSGFCHFLHNGWNVAQLSVTVVLLLYSY